MTIFNEKIKETEQIEINEIFTKPIVIHYEYIVKETDMHYFVSIINRTTGLNKCSVNHNKKEKTMTILRDAY